MEKLEGKDVQLIENVVISANKDLVDKKEEEFLDSEAAQVLHGMTYIEEE